MKGEVLKIKFRENMAFLTDEVALNFTQVDIEYCGKPIEKVKAPAFWTILVKEYIPQEQWIKAEILNYQPGETKFEKRQLELSDILILIEKVTFIRFDTDALTRTINGTLSITKFPTTSKNVYRTERPYNEEINTTKKPVKQIPIQPFTIKIKDVKFLDGKVRFEKKIQGLKNTLTFEITNPSLLEAYDAIKNYFEKVLNTKIIQVSPLVNPEEEITEVINAASEEINRIDATLIEKVKFKWLNTAINKETDAGQKLSTIEEFLEALKSETVNSQDIFKSETDLFDNLLERSGTKHYTNLRYLSSKHNHELAKLRILNQPLSFIFFIAGVKYYHIIWETLDTEEATYIWSYPKNKTEISSQLKQSADTIRQLLKEGKNSYLGRKAEGFYRVIHDYQDLQIGFLKWKEEINKLIT